MKRVILGSFGALCLMMAPHVASAQLQNVDQSQIIPETGVVAFPEADVGTYYYIPVPISSGPFSGSFIVFGSFFVGQTPGGVDPITIPEPSAPGQALQIYYNPGDLNNLIQIVDDPAAPNSPVLAGGPLTFRQPISIMFTTPIPAVGFTVGGASLLAGDLTIDAYDANGNSLGSVTSDAAGFENYGLVDPGGPGISGLTIQSSSDVGFDLDSSLFLGTPVPEPASLATLLAGLGSLAFARRRRRS